jgi:hypothetical protein
VSSGLLRRALVTIGLWPMISRNSADSPRGRCRECSTTRTTWGPPEAEWNLLWRSRIQLAQARCSGGPRATAFGVEIHDYRGLDGQVYYASRLDAATPAPLRDEVAEIGRIVGDVPLRRARDLPHNQ